MSIANSAYSAQKWDKWAELAMSFQVRFLGELEISKRHFETN